jgi:hypothetical protein
VNARFRWALALASLGCLLTLPALGGGLADLDDPAQRDVIQAHLRGNKTLSARPWYDIYNLVGGDEATAVRERVLWARPWWAWPGVRVRFFRPVAAATQYFDYWAFGDRYVFAHLHSLLWYFAACLSVGLLLLRVSADRTVALVGAAMFAMDDAHTQPAAWLAGRNALIGVTFFACALLLYDAACKADRLLQATAAGVCLSLALLATENVASTVPAFIAYATFLDRRRHLRRFASLAIVLAMVLTWYGTHRAYHFGASGSGAYLDPIADAGAFWLNLPGRYGALLHLHFGVPRQLWSHLPPALLVTLDAIAIWFGLPCLLIFLVRSVDRQPELCFWTCFAVLGLVPLTAAPPHERLLTHVGIALSMLLAHWLVSLVRGVRCASSWLLRSAGALLVATILAVHFALAPIALAVGASTFGSVPPQVDGASLSRDPAWWTRPLVVINVPSAVGVLAMLGERLRQKLPLPPRSAVLGATEHEVEVTRVDGRTFELYSPPGYLLDPFANFWRGPSVPMHQGARIALLDLTVLVVRVTPDGRPLRVRFQFTRALEDVANFVYWNGREFAVYRFRPIGQRHILIATFDHSDQLPEERIR